MKQTTIPIRGDASIIVRCNDDLCVEGIDSSTLVVIVEQGDSLRMKEERNKYTIQADSECRILLPSTAVVTIEKAGGDVSLTNLQNRAVIGKIGGDLTLTQYSGASIESVGGDCSIHNASGATEIARIGSSLYADGIQSLIAGSVGDDAIIKNIINTVDLTAGDEARLHSKAVNLPRMNVRAGNDIIFMVSPDSQGQLEISSDNEEIVVHAGGQDVEVDQHSLSLPLGNGGEMITLRAGDNVYVSEQENPDWEDRKPEESIHDHWKDFGFDIEKRIREGLKSATYSMESAARRANHETRRVQREIHRTVQDLNDFRGFQVGRPRKVVGFSVNNDSEVSQTDKSGPSDEERMMVLRMLQEKKISVEEAEKLLNALDR